MNVIFHIAIFEIKRLFKSPLAWIILTVVQILLAIFFFLLLKQFLNPTNATAFSGHGITEIVVAGFLQIAGIVLLIITPFITMRTFSEEFQNGSIKLLLSSPVTLTQIVFGKYLSVIVYIFLLLQIIFLMPLSLLIGTELDLLQLCSAFLGLVLLSSAFTAVGIFISTLTKQPVTAAIGTLGILFWLWIINIANQTDSALLSAILNYISLLSHYHNLLNGILNSADIIYYLLINILFIALSIWRLDSMRIQ